LSDLAGYCQGLRQFAASQSYRQIAIL